jgi:hypothetical protein
MALIIKKYSDNGRTSVLSKALETAKTDKGNNQHFISDETLYSVESFLPEWVACVTVVNKFLSLREKEVREKNIATHQLETVVRDLWDVAKRRIRRRKEPAEVLSYYQLPLSGIVPKFLKEKELLAISAKVIEGDQQAVAAGYPAMANPDALELKEALDIAQKEISDVAPADREYDQAEEAVEKLREQADLLISDIVDELKFNLRRKDAASQRRIILSYGIEIDYTNGGSKDESVPLEDM